MDKNDYKVINCPICGRKVGGHNELSKINSIFGADIAIEEWFLT